MSSVVYSVYIVGLALYRIDGAVCSKERQQIIDDFNSLGEAGSDSDEEESKSERDRGRANI